MTAELDPLVFPLSGGRLIEASAGTGKTFTIAALYLRLILGHGGEQGFGRALLPPEILVVTYTDAATKELRERIRQRLAQAARCFRPPFDSDDPLLSRLRLDYAPEQWPACARLLDLAAEWMDEAAVSTIHAWCGRMLREHAFDSGSLFSQVLVTDHGELKAEVVRDYWRVHCYPLSGEALDWVLREWQTPENLAAHLLPDPPALDGAAMSLAQEFARTESERARALVQLKAPWHKWLPEIQEILADGIKHKRVVGSKLQNRYVEPWLNALRDWLDSPRLAVPDLKSGWHRLSPEGMAEAWKEGGAPDHPAFAAIPGLQRALADLPKLERALCLHASSWVKTRFEQEKARRAELDFDDLLHRLDLALRGPGGARLAAAIRRQFPVALVDEFQDTDPVQYAIFSAVYDLGGGDNGLFLIGDPKQAIYAFRNADIHTYLAARRATEGRHYTLPTNFRSTEAMVAAVNQVFAFGEQQAQGSFLFRRGEQNPLPFLPVRARGRAERFVVQGAEQTAMNLWLPEDQQEPLGRGAYGPLLAGACAQEMVRLLSLGQSGQAGFQSEHGELRALRPGDMAVLVRSGAQARLMRRELSRRGVKSVYLSDKESVLASDEAEEVRVWLHACAEPDDERPLRAALASRLLNLPLAELERLNQDESAWEARVLQFRAYRQLWRRQGVLPMLRRLYHDFDLPQRLLAELDGERRLTNLLHLSELLQRWAGEVDGEQALIRLLCERRADDSSDEERILRLESDENLVKVVTIHKSKGLEYPLVFLPFAVHYRAVSGKNGVARFHDAHGEHRTVIAPSDEDVAAADQERLAEDLRLLYVALTRAIYGAWLGLADVKTGNGKKSDLHRSALGHLLCAGAELPNSAELPVRLDALRADCPHIALIPLPAPNEARFHPAQGQAPILSARQVRRSEAIEPWWIASYSALNIEGAESALSPAPDSAVAQKLTEAPPVELECQPQVAAPSLGTLHDFPRGSLPGVFLHELLEWAAEQGFAKVAQDPLLLGEAVRQRCERKNWSAWVEPLQTWLAHLLTMPLALSPETSVPGCSLAQLSVWQAELEFWFEARQADTRALDALVRRHTLNAAARPSLAPQTLNGMLKGFMDLVFEWQGRYYVADYKSNWLGPDDDAYTRDAMAQAILDNRYELQYSLYLLALHLHLKARLPDYDYERHIGGAVYLFLRGSAAPSAGLHFEKPPRELIEGMEAVFANEA